MSPRALRWATLSTARAQGLLDKVARIRAVHLRMDSALDTLDCVRGLDEQLRAVA